MAAPQLAADPRPAAASQERPAPPKAVAVAPRPSTGEGDRALPADCAPRILAAEQPAYPDGARSQGIEGTVRLEVHLSADGEVQEVQVADSSGSSELDAAACAAARRWRFAGAVQGGQRVAAVVRRSVVFRLDD